MPILKIVTNVSRSKVPADFLTKATEILVEASGKEIQVYDLFRMLPVLQAVQVITLSIMPNALASLIPYLACIYSCSSVVCNCCCGT